MPPPPEGYFAFPGEVIPPLLTLFPAGVAKPCGWGTQESKEFWGPVSLPQILALLGRPISRWQHQQVSWAAWNGAISK